MTSLVCSLLRDTSFLGPDRSSILYLPFFDSKDTQRSKLPSLDASGYAWSCLLILCSSLYHKINLSKDLCVPVGKDHKIISLFRTVLFLCHSSSYSIMKSPLKNELCIQILNIPADVQA